MGSVVVREAIMAEIKLQASAYKVVDYSEVAPDPIPDNQTDTFLIVQFIGGTDQQIDIGNENNHGFEEFGTAVLHILQPTGFSSKPTLALGDRLRKALRGRRIGTANDVVITAVEPFTDALGGSVGVEGPWHGFSANVAYERYECG